MSRAIRPGRAPGETVLRLPWRDVGALGGYSLVAALVPLGTLIAGGASPGLAALDLLVVAILASVAALLILQTVWLRPGELVVRRYLTRTSYPIADITGLRFVDQPRRAPAVLLTRHAGEVRLPVPTRTIWGLKGPTLDQIQALRDWAAATTADPVTEQRPSPARGGNPYAGPPVRR